MWRRIDRDAPADYWEHNLVAGRRRVRELLSRRLEPATGRAIVDLGCGGGAAVEHLAERGFDAFGVDRRPQFDSWERRRAGRFIAADLRRPAITGPIEAIIVQELLQDLAQREQTEALSALGAWPAERLFLVLRLAGAWQRWAGKVSEAVGWATSDPVWVLRQVHLRTHYRLLRRDEIRQRNYRVQIAEFRAFHDGA